MILKVPELEALPADERQAMLDEAVRQTNAAHGKMSRIFHYVGCALLFAVVFPLALMNTSIFATVLAGVVAYAVSLLVGMLMWRRSQAKALRAAICRIMARVSRS